MCDAILIRADQLLSDDFLGSTGSLRQIYNYESCLEERRESCTEDKPSMMSIL